LRISCVVRRPPSRQTHSLSSGRRATTASCAPLRCFCASGRTSPSDRLPATVSCKPPPTSVIRSSSKRSRSWLHAPLRASRTTAFSRRGWPDRV